MSGEVRLRALRGLPEVAPGDDLAALLRAAAERDGLELADGVLVVAQKVVSKAEGRLVRLADVVPSDEARRIANEDDKDPRAVEVVLRETVRVVRRGHRVLICETRHGFVCANAGVDLSNAPGAEVAVLLPVDPDASARRLRDALRGASAAPLGVVVSDTFGRPWREGLVDVALGCAGLAPVVDERGSRDRAGRELLVTAMAVADQMAAAAGLLMQKAAGTPAVWVEGVAVAGDGAVRDLLRDPASDLFR
ncbi:MAG TPA: coenzyme F420-0:L-glutamate ligase [Myxococcota bacterium]|nr:coenzyme F420-0:L-glutamate ligase [Myxococcota bacterium]